MKKLLLIILFIFFGLTLPLTQANPIHTANTEKISILKDKLLLGENYQNQGNYRLAAKEFEDVLTEAQKKGDKKLQAIAATASGYNYYLAKDEIQAQMKLEQARFLAPSLKNPALSALIENYSGMLYLSQQLPEKARPLFTNALKNARIAHDQTLESGILLNQVKLESDPSNRLKSLESVCNRLLTAGENKNAKLLLICAEQLLTIDNSGFTGAQNQQLTQLSYETLNKAYLLTESKDQLRIHSETEAYMANWYAQQHRNQESLQWLDKAIFDAEQIQASDLLTQWQTQKAKLLHITGDLVAATQSYKQAASHLDNIRHSLPIMLHNGKSSINQIIDPVHRGLADVLLLQAAKTSSSERKQKLIRDAIDSMEIIKQTELENFFENSCLVNDKDTINLKDQLLKEVAILYPVILPNRIEILFRAGESTEFQQQSTRVSADEVTATAMQMTEYLRQGQGNYRPASRKIYNWIVKPYDQFMKTGKITTIIFIPDGILRQVPLAALLNGKKFVVEDYATATLPTLNLKLPPVVNNNSNQKILIAALSKPDGPSVDELLKNSDTPLFGERGIINKADNEPVMRSTLVQELSLPSINNEVAALQKDRPNTTLINKTFTYDSLKKAISTGEYSIIHIASHGYFGENADKSFVMTYDKNLKAGDFQLLLGDKNIKKSPINLLTLSACQTAEGDDRALLGFSGIAIKTNALSAIGTLWSVDDVATARFMEAFYADLNHYPKAQALRQAQMGLLKVADTKHPHFWAPFIMVGNW